MTGFRIVFRPVLTVFVIAALVILVALGNWQMRRLEWKEALIAQVATLIDRKPAPFSDAATEVVAEYSPVEITGVYEQDKDEVVFGAIEGAPGVFVFTPMRPAGGGDLVYVNRGFAPQEIYEAGGASPAPGGEQTVSGLLRYPENPGAPAAWFISREKSADGLWNIRSPADFAAAAGLAASPFYIDAFAADEQVWPQGGTTRIAFSNRHLEYALTWFGLAGALIAVYIAAMVRQN